MARSLRFASRLSTSSTSAKHPGWSALVRSLRCPIPGSGHGAGLAGPRKEHLPSPLSPLSHLFTFRECRACSKAGAKVRQSESESESGSEGGLGGGDGKEKNVSGGTTHVLHVRVKKDQTHQPLRLDAFLATRLPSCSRARIQESVKAGKITVNGGVQVKPAFKLRPGDEVTCEIVERPPLNVEPEDIPLDVVYEDSSLIVINKPAGLVVHPAPGSPNGTLVNAVLHHCNLPGLSNTAIHVLDKEEEWGALSKSSSSSDEEEEEEEEVGNHGGGNYSTEMMYGNMPVPRPGIVHRLDKGTSGLIVVAKNDLAKEKLQSQFKERSVERQYLSLLCGHLSSAKANTNLRSSSTSGLIQGRVVTAIGRDKRERIRMASYPVEGVENKPHLKKAASNYFVKEVFVNGGASLVAWRLETGRTHQIRVHAKHLGSPLIGDDIYGGTPSTLARWVETCVSSSQASAKAKAKLCAEGVAKAMQRPALHAATLGFEHPETGEKMRFQRDPPSDFLRTVELLRSFSIQSE